MGTHSLRWSSLSTLSLPSLPPPVRAHLASPWLPATASRPATRSSLPATCLAPSLPSRVLTTRSLNSGHLPATSTRSRPPPVTRCRSACLTTLSTPTASGSLLKGYGKFALRLVFSYYCVVSLNTSSVAPHS